MQVKDIMTTQVITVVPETTIEKVALLLAEHHITGMPVVDASHKLLGLVTERNFLVSGQQVYLPTALELFKNSTETINLQIQELLATPVKDIMVSSVATISPDTELAAAARVFAVKQVNPLPVVDQNGIVVGILSRSDLIKLLTSKRIVI